MTHSFSCPITIEDKEVITMSHGSGGKETSHLIEQIFLPAFRNEHLQMLHDGALLPVSSDKLAFTTDSYVIQPLFFPGGDIGKLAVTGTINDLAMCGASPAYISCGFILEEGFLQSDLRRIVASMQKEAEAQSVQIVTGDTKVIERRDGKSLFINTSGIGVPMVDYPINHLQIAEGDLIILSGDIGRHGMAVIAEREELSFSSALESDCASLVPMVAALLRGGIRVHCLRDLTRGGLATAFIELAESSGMEFVIEEDLIPVSQEVNSACEILGIDPMYVANEGRFVAFVPSEQSNQALTLLESFSESKQACTIGKVFPKSTSSGVKLKNGFGSQRYLTKLVGDQLPRIC